ncbi:HzC4 chymotrypsinogen [Anopheles darlingi]|uniref:HzC4 chymotrypsinogen n=1 Tax=Anopheles darlingi TaxID=43151 RepID=W5J8D1_ANODA|nr:collagenase-like [Anopheles darlingi]ETN60717.1 HzC4 chymotrypsinogen [Anopheles darlingi]
MKLFAVLLLATVVLGAAYSVPVDPQTVDWSTVRTLDQTDAIRVQYGLKPLTDDEVRSSRISDGQIASATQFPWAVGVLISGTSSHSFCSGVLISRRHVLTAAVCISGSNTLTVLLGASDMTRVEEFMGVSNILSHPNYSSFFNRDDIAILTLSGEAPVRDTIRPVDLPRRSDVGNSFNNWAASTAGWGNTGRRENEPIPIQNLHFTVDSVNSNFVCGLSHTFIRDTHVCTSTDNGGPCNGDEGGPVTVSEGGRTFLIGIHSFHFSGLFGCDRGRSAVHTRITEYLDWIQQNSDVNIQ